MPAGQAMLSRPEEREDMKLARRIDEEDEAEQEEAGPA